MKLQIHKFKRLQDLTVNVPAQISGGNGTGKTSILESIAFCLTGKGLDGKDFEQIYDNRVDLHEAIADVSFFDDYGNEFRRTVKPLFETSRDGVERLKILRSTKCKKNGIDTNNFAEDFADFYKFGTDFFFKQKEADQRSIFIDLMKSLLPDFDVKSAAEKLKSLKKSQRDTVSEIKSIRAMLSELVNKEVPELTADLQKNESEYQKLIASISKNQSLIAETNQQNNGLTAEFRQQKNTLEAGLDKKNRELLACESEIERINSRISELNATEFSPSEIKPIDLDEKLRKLKELEAQLAELEFFSDVQEFGKKYATKNPVVKQNIEKIKYLQNHGSDDVSNVCPTCGVASPEALENSLKIKIESIKNENRGLLEIDMRKANNDYLILDNEREMGANAIEQHKRQNAKIEKEDEENKRAFEIKKTNGLSELNERLNKLRTDKKTLEVEFQKLEAEVEKLSEPTLVKLPETLTISEKLKQAHAEFLAAEKLIVEANAVNKNNAEIRAKKEAEIKEKQGLIADLDKEVLGLEEEISEYFSNLNGVVKKEFAGEIKIGVQLQELVITKNEYKDVFKITADGKVFPSECNGALINNVKLQILRTLQRLKNYNGITISDNAEANTTQPLNSEGLNLIVAKATEEPKLIIN